MHGNQTNEPHRVPAESGIARFPRLEPHHWRLQASNRIATVER